MRKMRREMRNVKKQRQREKEIPNQADPLTYILQHNTPEIGCFCSEMSTLCVELPVSRQKGLFK